VWNDNFAGPARSAPSAANWITDTGTGYPGGPANWGTSEVETMTNSTSNVSLDGNGHLNITALNNNGAWTSGRVETQRSDFAAPAGGQLMITASIQATQPRQRPWLLAGVPRDRRRLPGEPRLVAWRRRDRHHGERQRP